MQVWAGEKVPTVDWRAQTEQFKDHHQGNGTTKLDWEATWRTWMRNAATRFAPRANGTNGTPVARSDQRTIMAMAWARRQEARDPNRVDPPPDAKVFARP